LPTGQDVVADLPGRIAEWRKRTAQVDGKLRRLYDAIENGVADLSDPDGEGPHC
jgi:hypothetical protein